MYLHKSSNVIDAPETMWFPLLIVVVAADVYDAKLNELPPTVNVPFKVKLLNVTLSVVREVHPVLDLNSKPLVVVLKITRPVAGVPMAFRSVVVILGGKNPFVVDFKSNIAVALAALPSALIPTD